MFFKWDDAVRNLRLKILDEQRKTDYLSKFIAEEITAISKSNIKDWRRTLPSHI